MTHVRGVNVEVIATPAYTRSRLMCGACGRTMRPSMPIGDNKFGIGFGCTCRRSLYISPLILRGLLPTTYLNEIEHRVHYKDTIGYIRTLKDALKLQKGEEELEYYR